MSKFLNINEVNIDDQDLLVQTLEQEMPAPGRGLNKFGFRVEVNDAPKSLYGFLGDRRPEKAEIILRRDQVGLASNDIGFVRAESGNFKPIISEFDNKAYNQGWLDELSQRYTARKMIKTHAQSGFRLEDQVRQENGEVYMTFTQEGVI